MTSSPDSNAAPTELSLEPSPPPNGQEAIASPPDRSEITRVKTAQQNSSQQTTLHNVTQPVITSHSEENPWFHFRKRPGGNNDGQMYYLVLAITLMGLGVILKLSWLGLLAAIAALGLSAPIIIPVIQSWFTTYLTPPERRKLFGFLSFLLAIIVLASYLGIYRRITRWLTQFKYDEFGSWAEWVGALGQILIAILAVYVAWQQYVISRDLTIKQNRITQQQTIDTYFQGISELVLDNQGMLEDWPQERAIADGRTAAILSSVDAVGKAKILRFLSQSRLLTPLMRDRRLGRPLLDGIGGYAEDRVAGIRVINLGVILAGSNLAETDLRWADLSEANMVHANLHQCNLARANLSRTVLFGANLAGAELKGTRLFYGPLATATPRKRSGLPDYETGDHTGVVIEKADLSEVKNLTEEQRYYCCTWGGETTRQTIPGGCAGIPNQLGR